MNVGVINLSVEFGDSYLEALKKNEIDIAALTIEDFEKELPEFDGMIICEDGEQDTARTCSILLKLKENSNTPVWVFSLNLQKVMRTVYLQLGALGVLAEEYEPEELQLTISNNLIRSRNHSCCELEQPKAMELQKAESEDLKLIPRNHSVKINGRKEIPLTRLEYKTMELLYEHKNNTVAYKELFEAIWGEGFNNQNYRVANLIFHLREKIEEDSVSPVLIRTVRSKGYMLNLEA